MSNVKEVLRMKASSAIEKLKMEFVRHGFIRELNALSVASQRSRVWYVANFKAAVFGSEIESKNRAVEDLLIRGSLIHLTKEIGSSKRIVVINRRRLMRLMSDNASKASEGLPVKLVG